MRCSMAVVFEGEVYCDYYDFACMKCGDVKDCPEDRDEDEYDYLENEENLEDEEIS